MILPHLPLSSKSSEILQLPRTGQDTLSNPQNHEAQNHEEKGEGGWVLLSAVFMILCFIILWIALIPHGAAVGAIIGAAVQHVRFRVDQDALVAALTVDHNARLMPTPRQLLDHARREAAFRL